LNSVSWTTENKAHVLVCSAIRRKTMTKFSTLAVIATVAAVAIALPASAQSFDPEAGSGNVVPFSYAPIAARNDTVAVRQTSHAKVARQSGLHAFAMVPRGSADGNSNDPALTGGGSTGYNEMLQRF
jgi:hypothetical protein